MSSVSGTAESAHRDVPTSSPASISSNLSSTFVINIEGINPDVKNQKWKIKALEEMVKLHEVHVPFFSITETHLKSYHSDADVQIDGYTPFRADRKDRIKGGVAIYLHESLVADLSDSFSNSFCELVIIYNKSANIVISSIYRPPAAPHNKFDECLKKLQGFIDAIDSSPVIFLTGDFNLPFIDWKSLAIPPSTSILISERQAATSFLSFMETNFLTQLVTEPTRKEKNILDLILTNDRDIIHNISVIETELSDHNIVTCELMDPSLLLKPITRSDYTPDSPLDDIDFTKADWNNIRDTLGFLDWSDVLDPEIDQYIAFGRLISKITSICKENAPSHTQKATGNFKSSSIPKERRGLIRKRSRLNAKVNTFKKQWIYLVNRPESSWRRSIHSELESNSS